MRTASLGERFARLPGWELISAGLADVAAGAVTPCACLISIAFPRLERAGLIDPAVQAGPVPDAERTLYRLLLAEGGDGFSRYNALLRRLVSFEHALDRLMTDAQRSEEAEINR